MEYYYNYGSAVRVINGPVKTEKFTAESFLDFLRPSNDRWWHKLSSEEIMPRWIFRGQSNANWGLIPAALRPINSKAENWRERARARLYQRLAALGPTEPAANRYSDNFNLELYNEYIRYSAMIDEAVYRFTNLARTLSFMGRVNVHSPIETGNLILGPEGDQFSSIGTDGYDAIGLAQHHGIQTHFLDWSDYALFAVHFACLEGVVESQFDIAVWALNENVFQNLRAPKNFSDYTSLTVSDVLKVFRSTPQTNQYLAAQKGAFTYYSKSSQVTEFYNNNSRWPGINELLENREVDHPVLLKIVLQKKHVKRLRELIDREQITKAHLMPTLDNVAETVIARF